MEKNIEILEQVGWIDPDEPGLVWNMDDHDDDLSEFHQPLYTIDGAKKALNIPSSKEVKKFSDDFNLGLTNRQIDGVISLFITKYSKRSGIRDMAFRVSQCT